MKDERKTKRTQLVAELAVERQRRLKSWNYPTQNNSGFAVLVENAPDIIFRLNLLPSPHLEYLSPAIEQITGYSPEMFYTDRHLAYRSCTQRIVIC